MYAISIFLIIASLLSTIFMMVLKIPASRIPKDWIVFTLIIVVFSIVSIVHRMSLIGNALFYAALLLTIVIVFFVAKRQKYTIFRWILIAVTSVFLVLILVSFPELKSSKTNQTPHTPVFSTSSTPSAVKKDPAAVAKTVLYATGWSNGSFSVNSGVDLSQDRSTTGNGSFKEGITSTSQLAAFLNGGSPEANSLLSFISEKSGDSNQDNIKDSTNWVIIQSNVPFSYGGNTMYKDGAVVGVSSTKNDATGGTFFMYVPPELSSVSSSTTTSSSAASAYNTVAVRRVCTNVQSKIPTPTPTSTQTPSSTPGKSTPSSSESAPSPAKPSSTVPSNTPSSNPTPSSGLTPKDPKNDPKPPKGVTPLPQNDSVESTPPSAPSNPINPTTKPGTATTSSDNIIAPGASSKTTSSNSGGSNSSAPSTQQPVTDSNNTPTSSNPGGHIVDPDN